MDAEIKRRIIRAKELIADIHHVPLATVSEDGAAHNTPVFMAFDDHLTGYWSSHPETVHSHNIARDPRVFLVVFDSREGHGGLFVRALAQVIEDGAEARLALALLAKLKERVYGRMGKVGDYLTPGGPRLFKAVPVQLWVNMSQHDEHGVIVRDYRYEIPLSDLITD